MIFGTTFFQKSPFCFQNSIFPPKERNLTISVLLVNLMTELHIAPFLLVLVDLNLSFIKQFYFFSSMFYFRQNELSESHDKIQLNAHQLEMMPPSIAELLFRRLQYFFFLCLRQRCFDHFIPRIPEKPRKVIVITKYLLQYDYN